MVEMIISDVSMTSPAQDHSNFYIIDKTRTDHLLAETQIRAMRGLVSLSAENLDL